VIEIVNGRVNIQFQTANDPVDLDILEGYEIGIVSFNTDIAYFEKEEDCKVFLYGPGSILDAHTEHEYILIEELKGSVDIFVKMVKDLLNE